MAVENSRWPQEPGYTPKPLCSRAARIDLQLVPAKPSRANELLSGDALFQSQGLGGAYMGGPPCGDEGCRERAAGEDQGSGGDGGRISCPDAE